MWNRRLALPLCVLVLGCSEDESEPTPAGSGSATSTAVSSSGTGGGSSSSSSSSSSGSGGGTPGECTMGMLTDVGQLCVRGEPVSGGEELKDGGKLTFQLSPKGCFSSSCTTVYSNYCEVGGPGLQKYVVTANFCIGPNGGMNCLPDCGGGGFVACPDSIAMTGDYMVESGGLSLPFTVPSQLPAGGTCTGTPF